MHARNYGFTHTAFEALQQLRFMRVELEIPDAIREINFRHGAKTDFAGQVFCEPDLYFVEVSSAKLITVGDFAVQINYLYSKVRSFFSDQDRKAKFWSLARQADGEALNEWLENLPAFQELPEDSQDLLRLTRVTIQTKNEIEQSLSTFAELAGREKVILTTHINARAPDGTVLRSRDEHIADVEAAATHLNLPCYNPTVLMKRLGQDKALKDQGRDLTHFTDSFADALFNDWNAHFFALPAFAAIEFDDNSAYNPAHLDAMIKAGKQQDAMEYLRNAVQAFPSNGRLRRRLAMFEFELGNYDNVTAALQGIDLEADLAENDQELHLVGIFCAGDHMKALKYGESLLADELESPAILDIVAQCAEVLGKYDKALGYWKTLFLSGEYAHKGASRTFALLEMMNCDRQTIHNWAEFVHERYPDQEDALVILWRAALQENAGAKLTLLHGHSDRLSDENALKIAEYCLEAGFKALAADILVKVGEYLASLSERKIWLSSLRSDWREEGFEALRSGDKMRASQCLRAAQIAGDQQAGKDLVRLENAYLVDARAAYRERDLERVLQIFAEARSSLISFKQMELLAGRSHYILGDFDKAADHLLAEVEASPFDIRISRQLARAAIRAERYGLAIDQLLLVRDCDDCDPEELRETQSKLERMIGRSIRQARDLIDRDRISEARELLEKISHIDGSASRLEKEHRRLASELRKKIKSLPKGRAEDGYNLGKQLFALDPTIALGAKTAANAAMRLGQFAEAIIYLEALRPLAENPKSIDRNLETCRSRLVQAAA